MKGYSGSQFESPVYDELAPLQTALNNTSRQEVCVGVTLSPHDSQDPAQEDKGQGANVSSKAVALCDWKTAT